MDTQNRLAAVRVEWDWGDLVKKGEGIKQKNQPNKPTYT